MAKSWSPRIDMPHLDGKIAVVTGANSGLGFHTVKSLALGGAKVYFTARSESKATQTKERLLSENPRISSNQLIWLKLDLLSIESIWGAAEELIFKESKVDILVNNAMTLSANLERTDAGWEKGFAVGYIGHFVFTNGIMPLLRTAAAEKGSDVRIINVSSIVHHKMLPANYPLDFTKATHFDGSLPYEPWLFTYALGHFFTVNMIRYCVTKLAIVMFAQELQRRFNEEGVPIISLSVHPGNIRTDKALDIFQPWIRSVMGYVLSEEDQGSPNMLFAATARGIRQNANRCKGKYIEPVGNVHPSHPIARNKTQVEGLWDTTTKEVNLYLAKQGRPALPDW